MNKFCLKLESDKQCADNDTIDFTVSKAHVWCNRRATVHLYIVYHIIISCLMLLSFFIWYFQYCPFKKLSPTRL